MAVLDRVSQGMASAREAMQKAKPGYREVRHEVSRIEFRDRECLPVDVVRNINALAQGLPLPATEVSRDPAATP